MEFDRSKKPKDTAEINFKLPGIEKFSIKNGLKVIFVEKNNLPIINLNLVINAGSKFDPTDEQGAAYLTAMAIDEGAGNLSALELDNEIESLGSVLGVSVDHDTFNISLLTLKENFARSLELMSDIAIRPNFDDRDFIREKQKLLTKLRQVKDEPSYIASTVFEKIIFGNLPYSTPIMGTAETVQSISNSGIKRFYSERFSALDSTMIVVGNLNRQELENNLNNYFDKWDGERVIDTHPGNIDRGKTKYILINKADAPQTEIRIGHLSTGRNTRDYYSKIIMNTILGGQFSSRINLNLREDKGYTYGASSSFIFNRFSGYFKISTAVQSQVTGAAIKEILNELNRIREGIKNSEIDFAKSFLIKRYPALFETYSQVSKNLITSVLYSLPDDYFNTYIEKIRSCTKEEITEAAEKNIHPEELVVIAVGDKNVIGPQLGELTEKDIIELDYLGNAIAGS